MRIPTIQLIGVGPPVDKNGTPTGQSFVKRDGRVWSTIRNYWYTNGEWHHELLFYIGNMFDHLSGVSPNYRYWWHSAHRLYYAIIGEKKYRPLTEDWERYRCVFSPDSRYLAGTSMAILADEKNVSVFEMPSGRRRVFYSPHAYFIGWYPDGRRLWFGDWKRWFQLDVERWQARELSRAEVSALHRDWDLLNPRLRYVEQYLADPLLEPYDRYYAYSRNGRVRLGAFPCWWARRYDRPELREWRSQTVWVEWRDGKRVRLWQNRQEGVGVRPCDISDDGRWAIVKVQRYDENLGNVVDTQFFLFHIPEKRVVKRFELDRTIARYVSPHFGVGSILR